MPPKPRHIAVIGVWELATGAAVGEVTIPCEFGRLAIAVDGESVFGAAYERSGVVCVDVATGRERWRRRDVSTIQRLSTTADGRRLIVDREHGWTTVLDAKTGGDMPGPIRGAKEVWESPDGRWQFRYRDRKRAPILTDGNRITNIQVESWAVRSVAFGSDYVVYETPDEGVRCVDVASGATRWHRRECRTSQLAVQDAGTPRETVVAAVWSSEDRESRTLLERIDARSGEATPVISDAWSPVALVLRGSAVVCAMRDEVAIIDTRNGVRVRALALPPDVLAARAGQGTALDVSDDITIAQALANIQERNAKLGLSSTPLGERGE
jgi:PQQ-like domain